MAKHCICGAAPTGLFSKKIADFFCTRQERVKVLVCCLKGIWVHPYFVPPAKLAPDFGIPGPLWSGIVIVEDDILLRQLPTFILEIRKCLRNWCVVSQAYGCTLLLFHRPSWPKILEFGVTSEVEMMQLHCGWGSHPPQTTSHIHIRHIQSVSGIGMLSQGHMVLEVVKVRSWLSAIL